jgi:predicted Zn-dependent protease
MFFTGRTGRIVTAAGFFVLLAFASVWTGCGDNGEELSEDNITLKLNENTSEKKEVKKEFIQNEDSITAPELVEREPAEEKIEREVSYGEAEKAYMEGDYSSAVELFGAYTSQKEQNPWGHYMLGLSAWKANDYPLAEDSFLRALELDRGHIKSRINLSRVYLDSGRAGEAMEQLTVAREQDPESPTVYHLTGRAQRQLGETEKAIEAYRNAIRMDNEQVWAMNNLGLIYIREGQFRKALPPLARAAILRDDVPVFQNNLGIALENTGNYREAENAYAAAVSMDKSYDRAYNSLCRVELLQEAEEVGEIDLAAISETFIDQIMSRYETEKQVAEPADSTAAEQLITVAEADSCAAD